MEFNTWRKIQLLDRRILTIKPLKIRIMGQVEFWDVSTISAEPN